MSAPRGASVGPGVGAGASDESASMLEERVG